MYADGAGIVRIAHQLNADGVPSPRARGWAPAGIREMLYRTTYRGELVWGKLQKVTRRGTQHQRRRPESERLTIAAPEQRIIDDDLWQRAHVRLAARAAAMPTRFARSGRRFPEESAYFLVGFTECSMCRGPIGTDLRAHGSAGHRRHVAHYACLHHKSRGQTVCGNAVGLRQSLLDRAILNAIVETLHPRALEVAIQKAVAILTNADSCLDERREKLEHEMVKTQSRIERLVGALADATLPTDEIRPQLMAEKARKTALRDELAQLHGARTTAVPDVETIRRRLQALASDVTALLSGETGEARRVLRALLHAKIELEPMGRGRQRGYRFRGELSIGRFIAGTVSRAQNTSERGGPNGK